MAEDRNDELLVIKKTDLAEAVRQSFSAPGCDIVNSDVAEDPEYQKMIRHRLETVGNNSFGDVSAQLSRSSAAEHSSLSMLRSFLRRDAYQIG